MQLAIFDDCRDGFAGLLAALHEMDSRLNIGLSYQDYAERVGDIQVAYDQTDFDALVNLDPAHCGIAIGFRAETALQKYTEALQIWRECIETGEGCADDVLDPKLQGRWRTATNNIDDADEALSQLEDGVCCDPDD